jgi:hypothetical protein
MTSNASDDHHSLVLLIGECSANRGIATEDGGEELPGRHVATVKGNHYPTGTR